MIETLKAPFPWFGGKSRAAGIIWQRFGDVPNYVEPFAGSLAVLLGSPHAAHTETVNDIDCYLANFWRAVSLDPCAVARYADVPINEADLSARHVWLMERKASFADKMQADAEFYDAKSAGWWVWGLCCWIGSGWCSGEGPWVSDGERLVNMNEREADDGNGTYGIERKRPHLAHDGKGVNKLSASVGNAGTGVNRKLPHVGDAGNGVHRQLPHVGDAGNQTPEQDHADADNAGLYAWMNALAQRLRRVRVCCGDWSRVLGPSVTTKHGVTAVLLDPPYADTAARKSDLYAHDSDTVAHAVREWAIANGDNPLLRIALCGYESEHAMPPSWDCVAWKSAGGYGSQGTGSGRDNSRRERIWFSPHCLKPSAQGILAL